MRRRALVLITLTVLATLSQGAIVSAHARFDHSAPRPGQVLDAAPARVDIFTVQAMRKTAGSNEIMVTAPDGSRADDGTTVVDDADRKHFSVGLKPSLSPGRYLVVFKNLSDEDGEADNGRFAFYVGTPPSDAQKTEDLKLALTAKATGEAKQASHTGQYILIAIVVAALLALAAALLTRRRRSDSAG